MLDIKRLLKKAIKRKIRVTDALIVSFLISGNLLYAEDLNVTKDEIIINTNSDGFEPYDEDSKPYDEDGEPIDYAFNNYGTISGSAVMA